MPNSTLIQEDWANRDTIEAISVGIKKLAHFLNNFGKPSKFHSQFFFLVSRYYEVYFSLTSYDMFSNKDDVQNCRPAVKLLTSIEN